MGIKAVFVAMFLCTLIALLSTAVTFNIFPQWPIAANSAISGMLAGFASSFIFPWAKHSF